MKQIITIITLALTACALCQAQPASVKKAAGAVFKLTTYKADGTVLAESNGIFTDAEGTCISALTPFLDASRATVTDAKGRTAEVTRILGADELYDMAKFKVAGLKTEALPMATAKSKAGDKAWLITYGKDGRAVDATVKGVETFMDKYAYYIFSMHAPDRSEACPFVNAQGQVIGLMQPSTTSSDIHATDAGYALSLKTSGFAVNDPTLRRIGIAPALPGDKEQALLVLIMSEQNTDSAKHQAIVTDFINQYPGLVDGYTAKARSLVNNDKFDEAGRTMEQAIKSADKKDEAHAAYGKVIYDKLTYKANIPYEPWTLEKAADETQKAYAINPLPTYRHQLAQITFAQGGYQKAYDEFTALLNSEMNAPELYYEAAQCKTMLNAPKTEVIALLDSAINKTDTLRMREAAPYFLARAEAYNAVDSFRQAVFDYTRYEILAGGRMTAQFYYLRSQAEVKARLYQQALGDLAAAIITAPQEPTYYAEMASLQLKVNLTDEAIKTAQRCIELAPEYSDGYLLLGLAQISKGDKTAGLPNLEKARDLGNPQAQPLIEKYK